VNTAADIASGLGATRQSGQWWRCRCPVHGSRGATLALRDGDRGLIVKCWAACDPHDVLAMLPRHGLIACRGEGAWPAPVMGRSTDRADAARRTRLALRWLAEGRRVRIAMPLVPGTDFNDVLAGRDYVQIRNVAA
jgi:hypothetical protein